MGRRGAEYQEPERGCEEKARSQGHTQNTQTIIKTGAQFAFSVVRRGGRVHLFEHTASGQVGMRRVVRKRETD